MINWAELAIEIPICALACLLIHTAFEAIGASLLSQILILSGFIILFVCVVKLKNHNKNNVRRPDTKRN